MLLNYRQGDEGNCGGAIVTAQSSPQDIIQARSFPSRRGFLMRAAGALTGLAALSQPSKVITSQPDLMAGLYYIFNNILDGFLHTYIMPLSHIAASRIVAESRKDCLALDPKLGAQRVYMRSWQAE